MRFGVDYYPELYDITCRKEKMEEDIRLFKGMKMDIVRIMEFAWCEMEPEEGVFCFDWLDDIINTLGKNGIRTILCTPTIAPPMWLSEKYPETLYVNPDGSRRVPGSRHYSCCANDIFLDKCRIIVEQIASRYGNNPYIIGFQIDNELSSESNARCCCDGCAKKFRTWLKGKYGDIDTLNKNWGTLFWGQKFQNFEQIIPSKYIENDADTSIVWRSYRGVDFPSHRLDFLRFSSDVMVDYYDLQHDILKKHSSPDKIITTNGMSAAPNEIKNQDLFKKADVYAHDFYPDLNDPDKTSSSFRHALSRRIKDDGKFWVLETYCGAGHGNWARNGIPQGHPGTYRNNVIHAYASGAELLTLFKMHAFKSGYEQLGSCLIDLDRVPRRRYHEFAETGDMLQTLAPILDNTSIKASVAIIFDYDSLWSMHIKPISKEYEYVSNMRKIFKVLREYGIDADVITSSVDISKYKLLILPCFTVKDTAFGEKLKSFVSNGGTLISTYLSYSKDEFCNGSEDHMPLGLCDLFGMRVGEVNYIPGAHDSATISFSGKTFKNKIWSETLELNGAECYGNFADTYNAGECVISKNTYGRGTAYYIGTELETDGQKAFYHEILKGLNIKSFPVSTCYGVEIICRENKDETFYFVFNNNEKEILLDCNITFTDVLSGDICGKDGKVQLSPMQIRVLKTIR